MPNFLSEIDLKEAIFALISTYSSKYDQTGAGTAEGERKNAILLQERGQVES